MNTVARLISLGLLLAGLCSSASAASLVTQCGGVLRNTIKTTTDTFTRASVGFADVPNATFFVSVPSGRQQCVTVSFSASAHCPLGCRIRVTDGAAKLEPADVPNIFAEGNSDEVHSFQWVKRLSAGSHTIKVQVGIGNSAQSATFGPYTATLEVANSLAN
jgi:hypothetical protein